MCVANADAVHAVPFADRDPFVNGLAIFSGPTPKLENIKARIRPPHHSLKYLHWAAMRKEKEIEEYGRVLSEEERADMRMGKGKNILAKTDAKGKGKWTGVKWWIRTTEEMFEELWEEHFGEEGMPGLEPDSNVPVGEDPVHSPEAEVSKSPEAQAEAVDGMNVDAKVEVKPKKTRKGKRGTKRKVK